MGLILYTRVLLEGFMAFKERRSPTWVREALQAEGRI